MRTLVMALSAATLTVPAIALPTTPAVAQSTYHGKTWRGSDGRIYCRKPNGTTGLVVGGAAGALAGRAIAGRGSRTTGTVLGAAVGALLGRHVERNVVSSRRCR
ncbi:MAG TPA: glycine zipper 2TM domain-containing protein [Allosphingosinicella sp.]|jgi:outer membrane lipoprotein SlyB